MKTHKEFVEALKASKSGVDKIASKFALAGHCVRVLPTIIVPEGAPRSLYMDDGDIELTIRLEVKHNPNIDFKSVEEFPYDYIIVDEAYKIEKKHRCELLSYFLLNSSETGYIEIPVSTKKHWYKITLYDHKEERQADFYCVDKKFVCYKELKE